MSDERKHPYWPELTDAEGDVLSAYFDTICGDCVDGRCHWGSAAYRAAAEASGERCGCDRHADSVEARRFESAGKGEGDRSTIETALAWWRAREAL